MALQLPDLQSPVSMDTLPTIWAALPASIKFESFAAAVCANIWQIPAATLHTPHHMDAHMSIHFETLPIKSVTSHADFTLHWRHNDHDGVPNHQPHGCLLNRLFRCRSKKTSKPRVTGLCVGNSPGPVNFPHKGPVTRKMFPYDDVIMRQTAHVTTPLTVSCPKCSIFKGLCSWALVFGVLRSFWRRWISHELCSSVIIKRSNCIPSLWH